MCKWSRFVVACFSIGCRSSHFLSSCSHTMPVLPSIVMRCPSTITCEAKRTPTTAGIPTLFAENSAITPGNTPKHLQPSGHGKLDILAVGSVKSGQKLEKDKLPTRKWEKPAPVVRQVGGYPVNGSPASSGHSRHC